MASKRPRAESFSNQLNSRRLKAAITSSESFSSSVTDESPQEPMPRQRVKDEFDIEVGYHAYTNKVIVYARGVGQKSVGVRFRAFVDEIDRSVPEELRDQIRKNPTIAREKVIFVKEVLPDWVQDVLKRYDDLSQLDDKEKQELATLIVYSEDPCLETMDQRLAKLESSTLIFVGQDLEVGTFKHDPAVKVYAYLVHHDGLKFHAHREDIERSPIQIGKSIKFPAIIFKNKFIYGDKEKTEVGTKDLIRTVLRKVRAGDGTLRNAQPTMIALTTSTVPAAYDQQSGLNQPSSAAQHTALHPGVVSTSTDVPVQQLAPVDDIPSSSRVLSTANSTPTQRSALNQHTTVAETGRNSSGQCTSLTPNTAPNMSCSNAIQIAITNLQEALLVDGQARLDTLAAEQQRLLAEAQARINEQQVEITLLRQELDLLRTQYTNLMGGANGNGSGRGARGV